MYVRKVRDVPLQEAEPGASTPSPEGNNQGRYPKLEAALGARIRAARVAAGMSQTALGVAVGVTFQQVQKYEQGRDRVAASTLQVIAQALNVHPGSFFDDLPALAGSARDVRAAMRFAEVAQRIRRPVVLKQTLALMEAVAEVEGGQDAAHLNGSAEPH